MSGRRAGGNEQNTGGLWSLYATALQGGETSLLELCLGGQQVRFLEMHCDIHIGHSLEHDLKIFRTKKQIQPGTGKIIQEQPEAIGEWRDKIDCGEEPHTGNQLLHLSSDFIFSFWKLKI